MTPDTRLSVIFVREWDQQMSSSGCCGRVEGDFLGTGTVRERIFSERRECMEAVGVLYRALRQQFGEEVEIRILDPRNLLSLIPILWQEGRRHGVPSGETLRSMLRLSVNMLIVNGRIVARNDWPEAEELIERIERSRGRNSGTRGPGGRQPGGPESVSGAAPRDGAARRA